MCLGFEHTAFRLETRERYADDEEQEPLRRFLAGEPADDGWFMDWYEAIQALTADGRRMERVRVVTEPASDYTRFGIDLARVSMSRPARTSGTCRAGGPESWVFLTRTSGCWTPAVS